jgi:hypothetical protein
VADETVLNTVHKKPKNLPLEEEKKDICFGRKIEKEAN